LQHHLFFRAARIPGNPVRERRYFRASLGR
jgi:hypothetical protein